MDSQLNAAFAQAGEALAGSGPRQVRARGRKLENAQPAEILHLAVVTAADGIRFAAAERRADVTLARVADYVSENSPAKLWPHPARSVRDLLARGEVEEAVRTYFRFVGERWDAEQLHLRTIRVEGELLCR